MKYEKGLVNLVPALYKDVSSRLPVALRYSNPISVVSSTCMEVAMSTMAKMTASPTPTTVAKQQHFFLSAIPIIKSRLPKGVWGLGFGVGVWGLGLGEMVFGL